MKCGPQLPSATRLSTDHHNQQGKKESMERRQSIGGADRFWCARGDTRVARVRGGVLVTAFAAWPVVAVLFALYEAVTS